MSDLAVMFPASVQVGVEGKIVTVRPVKLRDFEAFAEAAGGVIALLADATPAAIYGYAKKAGVLQAILGKCTSLTAWQIRRLPAATAVELMVHVVRVNSGFFGKALLAAAAPLAGQMSPSN